jgi:hypothetical protein
VHSDRSETRSFESFGVCAMLFYHEQEGWYLRGDALARRWICDRADPG